MVVYVFVESRCFSPYGREHSVVSSCWLKCVWSAGVDDPPSPEDLAGYYRSPGSARSNFLHAKTSLLFMYYRQLPILTCKNHEDNWLENLPDISKAFFVVSLSSILLTAIPVRGSFPCVSQ